MKNFVERSVLMNPEERWTTAQLLKHEWLVKLFLFLHLH